MSKKQKRPISLKMTGTPHARPRITAAIEQAEQRIANEQFSAALDILESLAEQYPQDPELQYWLGCSHVKAGDLWKGALHYQKVLELTRRPDLLVVLFSLYQDLELKALSLDACRRALKQPESTFEPFAEEIRGILPILELEMENVAGGLHLPVATVEEGLRLMEQGQISLHNGDYPASIHQNRHSIKLLRQFPAPYNNLTLALFFSGKWEEAIQTAQLVLAFDPENIQALSNIVRYLAWTGQEPEARSYWERLKHIQPYNPSLRFKMAEAAAALEEDEAVYNLLLPIVMERDNKQPSARLKQAAQLRMAIAEANLQNPNARNRLNQLKDRSTFAAEVLAAINKGQRGVGWSKRFPYFVDSEYLPLQEFDRLTDLIRREMESHSKRSRQELDQFVARFPQIVQVGKKIIYEHQAAEAGIQLLEALGSPAAYAVLREFGLSQAGSDEERKDALNVLLHAGQIRSEEPLRIWQNGRWVETYFSPIEIVEDDQTDYTAEVADLLNQGVKAIHNDQQKQAEKLLLRAIALEPRAKEGYNNLASIYESQGNDEKARVMYEKALEIDPMYPFPRCALALKYLSVEDLEGAEAQIEPLKARKRFSPQSFVFLCYTRAQIGLFRDDFESARNFAEMALKINPEYSPARELISRIEMIQNLKTGWAELNKRAEFRNDAARARLQKRISTIDPSLKDVFDLYSKEQMTAMGRRIIQGGGWSAYKKAKLQEYLIENLHDEYILEQLVAGLEEKEREALQMLLERGGYQPWQEFDAAYGNDLEDWPYWYYHEPKTVMGRLRLRGLLAEATVNEQLFVTVPVELRGPLKTLLG